MTANQFRRLALSLPGNFRECPYGPPGFSRGWEGFRHIGYPDDAWGMVKLTPARQKQFVRDEPKVFEPVKGDWGRQGSTSVRLKSATKSKLFGAMVAAWRNAAPKSIADGFDD